jgi:hypothetical protein
MDHRSVPKANVDRCHTSDAFDGPIHRSQSALYTRLLGSLLLQRFKSYDRSTVKIHVEQNGEVSVAQVNELVVGLYGDLERRNERRPIVLPECALQTKQEEPAFSSLPDALLWIFHRTFGAKEGAGELDFLPFERLRDKYRHVVNADSEEMFSRRHPVEIRRRPPPRDAQS